MRKSVLARVVLGVSVGLLSSLIVGMGSSYLLASPTEGLFAGVIVSSLLFVATLILLSWALGSRPLNQRLFILHSFLGLATGILLVVIVLSGVLLMFRGGIETWSQDWLRVDPGVQFASADAWLDAVETQISLDGANRVDIAWPKSSTLPAEIDVSGPDGFKRFHVDPYRATLLEGDYSTWMDWVRELHASLHMKRAGSLLVGLTGLGAIWLSISGLLMRSNLFKDWRVLRRGMGVRIFVGDLHKRLASWLFPFVLLIAFSGMLIAFFGVLSVGPVEILFNGSKGEMYTALGYPMSVSRTEKARMPDLELFTQIVKNEMPGAQVTSVRVIGFGDRDAIVSVRASRQNDLAPRGGSLLMNFRAATNDVLFVRKIDDMGVFHRFNTAMVALHIADFDGLGVRMFYAGASVALILLAILGAVIWVLRRRDRLPENRGGRPKVTH